MKVFERLIDPYAPADGPPPRTLFAYGKWALRGAGPAIWLLVVLSIAAGIAEAAAAWLVGWAVDLAARTGVAETLPPARSLQPRILQARLSICGVM